MAYTTTAREFFDNDIGAFLGSGLSQDASPGTVEFEISGDNGGTYWIDFDAGQVSTTEAKPHCIVRASDGDFMALVEGRMSVADGLMTKRLRVSGEGHRIGRLFKALRQAGDH